MDYPAPVYTHLPRQAAARLQWHLLMSDAQEQQGTSDLYKLGRSQEMKYKFLFLEHFFCLLGTSRTIWPIDGWPVSFTPR